MFKSICIWGIIPFAIYFFTKINSQKQQENSAPEIKILKPLDQSVFDWNSVVPYSISVSDPEDGKSEYDEINNQEVIMEIMFFPDSSALANYSTNNSKSTRNLLREMSRHNCLNCHAARNKLIGPSFDLIAQRYVNKEIQVDLLATKLIDGSTGVWGEEKMPPQPDLKLDKAQEMVRWILKFGDMNKFEFYAGTSGAFKTKPEPDYKGESIYLLTASYTDHGLGNGPNSSKEGIHSIVMLSTK